MKAHVEFDDRAAFRIVVEDVKGQYEEYHGVATLKIGAGADAGSYIAVSGYLGNDVLEPEKVYRIEEV